MYQLDMYELATEVAIPVWFGELGWVGVVVLAVILIFTGKLRTDREIKANQHTIKLWQEAYNNERDARHDNLEAVKETLKSTELILNIVMAWDDLLRDEILEDVASRALEAHEEAIQDKRKKKQHVAAIKEEGNGVTTKEEEERS